MQLLQDPISEQTKQIAELKAQIERIDQMSSKIDLTS